jgi:hypothetical protein
VIPEIVGWLKGEEGYQESYVFQTMINRNLSLFELDDNNYDPHDEGEDLPAALTPEESGPPYRSEEGAKSYALRLLIHYLGDIHQPLHCATHLSRKLPGGDHGGTLFPIPYHYSSDTLHAVWDSALYYFHTHIVLVRDFF